MSSSLESVSYLQRAYKADTVTCYKLNSPEPYYAYIKCKKTIKTIYRNEVDDGDEIFKMFGIFELLTIHRTKVVEETKEKKILAIELPNQSSERFVERLTRDLADCPKKIVHTGKFISEVTEKELSGNVSIRILPKIFEHEDKIVIVWTRY